MIGANARLTGYRAMGVAVFPSWLNVIALASLALGFAAAFAIAIDLVRRPQSMAIMNLVWPLTALFGSLLWLFFYFRFGREPQGKHPSMGIAVAKSTTHCGAGCVLGDIIAEWAALLVPGIAIWFGWGSVFGAKMFTVWVPDLLLAFLFGIAFQYFSIAGMRDISFGAGLVQAIKADIASILAWQIGMYGCMAAAQLLWVRPAYGTLAPVDSALFWFLMQIAMLCGFATSFPVNWLLVRAGVKEKM